MRKQIRCNRFSNPQPPTKGKKRKKEKETTVIQATPAEGDAKSN